MSSTMRSVSFVASCVRRSMPARAQSAVRLGAVWMEEATSEAVCVALSCTALPNLVGASTTAVLALFSALSTAFLKASAILIGNLWSSVMIASTALPGVNTMASTISSMRVFTAPVTLPTSASALSFAAFCKAAALSFAAFCAAAAASPGAVANFACVSCAACFARRSGAVTALLMASSAFLFASATASSALAFTAAAKEAGMPWTKVMVPLAASAGRAWTFATATSTVRCTDSDTEVWTLCSAAAACFCTVACRSLAMSLAICCAAEPAGDATGVAFLGALASAAFGGAAASFCTSSVLAFGAAAASFCTSSVLAGASSIVAAQRAVFAATRPASGDGAAPTNAAGSRSRTVAARRAISSPRAARAAPRRACAERGVMRMRRRAMGGI
mmetsp:Transcript_11462/g.29516  ORF Transcript_11462/g.29516 Transcript_11462/m.29516 type:complete len:389 (+) Transcript_11462:657-1823(+)